MIKMLISRRNYGSATRWIIVCKIALELPKIDVTCANENIKMQLSYILLENNDYADSEGLKNSLQMKKS